MQWRSWPKAQRDGLMKKRTIVFVDEVHRFCASRCFLPLVRGCLFTFMGATTENPSSTGAAVARRGVLSRSAAKTKQITAKAQFTLLGAEAYGRTA